MSMKSVGQLQPIRVRRVGEKYVIVDGERRYRAARKLGLPTLAAIVEAKPLEDSEIIQRQLIANLQRDDLQPLEKAKGFQKLLESSGWPASKVASQVGLSNASFSRILSLLEMPAEIQAKVASGAIPASSAYQLAKISDPVKQGELAEQVASGTLTRDALAGSRKAAKRSNTESPAKPVSRVTATLGSNKSVTVAGQSLTLDDFISLLEECLSKARQSRTKGLALSTFVRMCKDTAHVS
jgi:ParB family chromosome partitioning protein